MRLFPISIALLTAILTACSGSKDKVPGTPKPAIPPTIHEESLHQFTGARTKLVWSQYQNADKSDKQGTSRHQFLFALDSADGRGAYKVLEPKGNYAFPIITPDGERIVFTQKRKVTKGDRRRFDTLACVVNFDGSGLRELGEGYAQEVWKDPDTGKFWVYAGDDFVLGDSTAPVCKRIIRFPLDDPDKRETVWDRTRMGTDAFAISADGKRFAGLFPWPDAGIGDLENKDWEKLTSGCWTSMAPDNSYRSWVFDGPHQNLLMFDGAGNQTAKVRVNNHPDLKGHEVYHPRWGNHPRFFALSGPHSSGKGKDRGEVVEIYLGKFSPGFDRVEGWFKVTDNGLPDIYPDIWVETDPTSSDPSTPSTPVRVASDAKKWPSSPQGLVFKWQNVQAKNEFTAPDGSNQVSKAEPKGFARHGRNFEMALDGGTFEPIVESGALVGADAGRFGFQGLITANSKNGTIFRANDYQLTLDDGQLSFSTGSLRCEKFAPLPVATPVHIAISVDGDEITTFADGAPTKGALADTTAPGGASQQLVFGGDFDGLLEHIAFYNRPLTAAEAAADSAFVRAKLDKRQPVEQIKVKGRLVAVSELPTLETIQPYVRALVYYAYQTDHPEYAEIAVTHWAILDKMPVGGLPREVGKTYDLTLEPFFAHPELESQAGSQDEEAIDITLTLFHDVTTPQP